jgi:hypothetical protein
LRRDIPLILTLSPRGEGLVASRLTVFAVIRLIHLPARLAGARWMADGLYQNSYRLHLRIRLGPRSVRQPLGESWFGRKPHHDLRRLVPRFAKHKSGAGLQRGFDLRHQGIVDDHARFEVQRPHLKNTLLAVSFRVDATDQLIVVKDRQGEIAILAFRARAYRPRSCSRSRISPGHAPGPTRAGRTAKERSFSSVGSFPWPRLSLV